MFPRLTSFVRQFDRQLWILSLGWFVGSLGFAASIPFLSIYFHERMGLSMTQIGLFFGAMAVVRAIFQAIGGELSDRLGRRGLLIVTQYVRSGAFVALALAISFESGFWMIAALVTVNYMFGAMFFPAVSALVSDILPEKKRLDGYAITRAAGNLGWAAGPAIGGFLAHSSYSVLFHISALITLGSALVFQFAFVNPPRGKVQGAFRLSDLTALGRDTNLATHCLLCFVLYLVVAQLVAPLSVYTVEMVGISESQLGMLFTLNGLMVSSLQILVTRAASGMRFTTQLATGALLYLVGYGSLGFIDQYWFFMAIIVVVTTGEMLISPPSLTLVSRLAPEGRMGRYMGVYGFFMTGGWSFGPLYGGWILDQFSDNHQLAWLLISSLALVAAVGFFLFGRRLDDRLNRR